MILLDLNQLMISNLMMHHRENKDISEDLLRHMILNSIRLYNLKFKDEFGEMVIASDGKNYWRRDYFPYYKSNRKKARDETKLDWKTIFESLNKIRNELKEYFPYRVINLEKVEADDIIATLIMENSNEFINSNKFLIISSDKDFNQLLSYPNVKQYDPIKKKYITVKNPNLVLKEHIIRGDIGDGIPNMLSSDSSIILGERQKSITSKKLELWLKEEPEVFCNEEMLRNYYRNKTLIDFSSIPKNIKDIILQEYENQSGKNHKQLFNYFVTHRLKNLMSDISDF